jgi:hypothetical protein
MKTNGSLDHRSEVELFVAALCYNAQGHNGAAIRSLVRELDVMATDFHGPTAKAYLKAGFAIQVKNLSALNREGLETLLKDEIFPNGRAAEDFRENVLDVFDIVADALATQSVPGFERERNLEGQTLPSHQAQFLKPAQL